MTHATDLLRALKPFAFLCELHDKPSIPDSDGMIFPGSKAMVKMGYLRRAHALYFDHVRTEAEAEHRIRATLKSRCPTCNEGAVEAYETTNPQCGLKASVTYACGHVFMDDTLAQAKAVRA